MNPATEALTRAVLIGIGATAALDVWVLLLRRLGLPAMNIALIGRWAGHVLRGRWRHPGIARAAPVPGELALGWLVHYAVGIAFAGLLLALQGLAWARDPSLLPALCLGAATVAAPWFVMQPAMGAGIASRLTPAPLRNALRSLLNHTVFGAGLYLAAALTQGVNT